MNSFVEFPKAKLLWRLEMNTTSEVINMIREMAAAEVSEERFVRVMQIGDVVRQGDLYLERAAELSPSKLLNTQQLAPGTTQGSRHVAVGATVYAAESKDPLMGPVVVASERWCLAHPEHANISMPSGTYRARYQRDWLAEQKARVMD
jgi:hypothetical protein